MKLPPDYATFLDPFLFSGGFLFIAAGLVLSQIHRDEGILLPLQTGLPFNFLRKISAVMLPMGVVLGFWIVGVWWLLWLPILVMLSGFAVEMLRNAPGRLPMTMIFMAIGLSLLFWTQGPTLRELGLLPHF